MSVRPSLKISDTTEPIGFYSSGNIPAGPGWDTPQKKPLEARSEPASISYFSDTELITIGGQTSNGGPLLVPLPNIEMYEEGIGWYEIGEIYPPR